MHRSLFFMRMIRSSQITLAFKAETTRNSNAEGKLRKKAKTLKTPLLDIKKPHCHCLATRFKMGGIGLEPTASCVSSRR